MWVSTVVVDLADRLTVLDMQMDTVLIVVFTDLIVLHTVCVAVHARCLLHSISFGINYLFIRGS